MKSLIQTLIFLLAASFVGATALAAQSNYLRHGSDGAIIRHLNDQSTVLTFSPSSGGLSLVNQSVIDNLISDVGQDNIARLEVAVWSDQDFPKTGSDLTKPQVNLAASRLSAINDYLKSKLSTIQVSTYNMAETSNWLARTLRTDQAELKSAFAKEASPPMERKDFELIEENGGPLKAVLVAVPKVAQDNDLNDESLRTSKRATRPTD